jgi:hypothetical protein
LDDLLIDSTLKGPYLLPSGCVATEAMTEFSSNGSKFYFPGFFLVLTPVFFF